jgi:hypothetical protein
VSILCKVHLALKLILASDDRFDLQTVMAHKTILQANQSSSTMVLDCENRFAGKPPTCLTSCIVGKLTFLREDSCKCEMLSWPSGHIHGQDFFSYETMVRIIFLSGGRLAGE